MEKDAAGHGLVTVFQTLRVAEAAQRRLLVCVSKPYIRCAAKA